VKRCLTCILIFVSCSTAAHPTSLALHVGDAFTTARTRLYAEGWRADPLAHLGTGEYMGLDRELVQNGFDEVDYCSVDKSLCVLQYIKGETCLRVHTQGEHIRGMKIEGWSDACRERATDEMKNVPSGDVRYLLQWRNDCEQYGQCIGVDKFLAKLKKKYAPDQRVMAILNAVDYPIEAKANPK
jgi:hypothetical protein